MEVDEVLAESGRGESEPTSVWERLKQTLEEEMTPADLGQIMILVKDHIGINMGPLWESTSPRKFLEVLENNMPDTDAVTLLKHVMAITNYHVKDGTVKVTDMVEEMEVEDESIRRKYKIERLDSFVGRTKHIERMSEAFTSKSCKGVWLSGLGGMGKTTLAKEVCHRLAFSSFNILNVDLKSKDKVGDFAREILLRFDRPSSESGESDLVEQALQGLRSVPQGTGTILLVDNMDDLLVHERDQVLVFVEKISLTGVKLCITARERVGDEESTLGDELLQLAVEPLEKPDAIRLLRLLSKPRRIQDDEGELMVDYCGFCPLDIAIVARHVQQPDCPLETYMTQPLTQERGGVSRGVERCIRETFVKLEDRFQKYLLQLSLFLTDQFSISDAVTLLQVGDAEARAAVMFFQYRHLLDSGRTSGERQQVFFEFHPRVSQFLTAQGKRTEHCDLMRKAASKFLKLQMRRIDQLAVGSEYLRNFYVTNNQIQRNRSTFKDFLTSLTDKAVESAPPSTVSSRRLQDIALNILTPKERRSFWRKMQGKFSSGGNKAEILYWKVEEARAETDDSEYVLAEQILTEIEEANILTALSSEHSFVGAEFFYVKGRLRRFQGQEHFTDALECLNKALEWLTKCEPVEDFVAERSVVENAIGNVLHDRRDYVGAEMAHRRALEILQREVQSQNHPFISLYQFNIGVVAFARAEITYNEDRSLAEQTFLEALAMCKRSMEIDVEMNLNCVAAYGDKLIARSRVNGALGRFDEKFYQSALGDANNALDLRKKLYGDTHSKVTLCYSEIAGIYYTISRAAKKSERTADAKQQLRKSVEFYDLMARDVRVGGLNGDETGLEAIFTGYLNVAMDTHNAKKVREVEAFILAFRSGDYNRDSEESTTSTEESESDGSSSPSGSDSGVSEGSGVEVINNRFDHQVDIKASSTSKTTKRKRLHSDSD